MSQTQFRLLALACAISAAACSKSSAAAASADDASPAASSAGADQGAGAARAIDCKKLFVPADVAGVLVAPATVSAVTIAGSPGCKFETPGGAGIYIYVSSGDNARFEWTDVSATSDNKNYTAISGIGDAAFWRDASASAWFNAKKGGKYCSVNLGIPGGAEQDTPTVHGVELAKKLGALCVKGFAAT